MVDVGSRGESCARLGTTQRIYLNVHPYLIINLVRHHLSMVLVIVLLVLLVRMKRRAQAYEQAIEEDYRKIDGAMEE